MAWQFLSLWPQGGVAARQLVIITIAFENAEVIERQIRQFRITGLNEFKAQLIIVDNSRPGPVSLKIKSLAAKRGVDYYRVPDNPYSGVDPSKSHGYALNYAARRVAPKYACDWVGFLDHDIFLFKSFKSFLAKLDDSMLAYGVINHRKDKWYYWPGFCFFNRDYFNVRKLDFMPSLGLDTGGSNWDRYYLGIDKKRCGRARLLTTYEYGSGERNKQRDAVQLIDGSWLHLVNASNWAGVDMAQKVEKLDTLIETLTIKDQE